MRILITGGTGFIGSRLALELLGRGHEVLVLGRPGAAPTAEKENADELRSAGGGVRAIDVNDVEGLAEAVRDREIVYHFAAVQHEMNVPDSAFRRVNVEGVRSLVEACIEAGVRRFVHGSTIGVHGDGSTEPIAEDSPLEPTNVYDVTKKEGEAAARSLSERIEIVILRIGETYGPGDRRLLKLFRGIQRGRFFLIGSGKNLHQPIYVDDLVDGLVLAAEHERAPGQTMLMAGPEAITTRRMAETVAQALGTRLVRWRAPMSVFLAIAFVLETALRPLGIQPPLHRRRMNFFRLNLVFRMDHAKEIMGFAPHTRFEEGALLTAAWYREKGLISEA